MMRFLMVAAFVGVVLLGSELMAFATRTNRIGNSSIGNEISLSMPGLPLGKPVPDSDPAPDRANEWVVQVLSRPLFSATRRPASAVVTQGGRFTAARLVGVVSWPDGKFAIFQTDEAEHTVVVSEGGALNGWTVQSIAAEGVTMRYGQESQVLHPAFGTSDPGAAQPPIGMRERGRDEWGRHPHPPSYLDRRG
jgi:hypothetical protein